MKKTYIQPALHIVVLQSESVCAVSLPVVSGGGEEGTEVPGSGALSHSGGWNSDNWTNQDED